MTTVEAVTMQSPPLSAEELRQIDAYWRAANYLSVGQIYLLDNPLLSEPMELHHIKPRLPGHWGTTPGLNFIYVHLNRVIRHLDLNVIERVPKLSYIAANLKQIMRDKLVEHREYINQHGQDMPEILNWKWSHL